MTERDSSKFHPADMGLLLPLQVSDDLHFAARQYAEARRCDTWIADDERLCLIFICRFACCARIKPTREGTSYAELRHGRSLRHICHMAGVPDRASDVRTLVAMMVKYPQLRLSANAARAAIAANAARLALEEICGPAQAHA